jgi:hypothetical protein
MIMAEGERFELSEERKTPQRFSRPPLSATQASLRIRARTKITSYFGMNPYFDPRRALKKFCIKVRHSFSMTPGVTSIR